MSLEGKDFYPGERASPHQLLALADAFSDCAPRLREGLKGTPPVSKAPFRLVAIHAIELYLNAYLRYRGLSAPDIRGFQHNLGRRLDQAEAKGLKLRKGTLQHLHSLSMTREYLASRYDPETLGSSQLTRLQASLDDVRKKVSASIPACDRPQQATRLPLTPHPKPDHMPRSLAVAARPDHDFVHRKARFPEA